MLTEQNLEDLQSFILLKLVPADKQPDIDDTNDPPTYSQNIPKRSTHEIAQAELEDADNS